MQRVGRIGSTVEPTITPKAKKLVVEVPIYFNQYIPGVDDATLEVIGVFLDERAERLNDMAQKDMKNDQPTQGKGMMVEVLGKMWTHKYKDKDTGRIVKQTKMYIYDVTYPNIYGNTRKNQSTPDKKTNEEPSNESPPSNPSKPRFEPSKEPDDPVESYQQFVKQ